MSDQIGGGGSARRPAGSVVDTAKENLRGSRTVAPTELASYDAMGVKVLLDMAHLTVSDEELEGLARSYAVVRAQADGLYLPELQYEWPAMTFDPLGPE
jgi:hypothetical protein